jgi:peptidoglycan/xylan/chitin deacetylase (PgdA/CDA1 family)
VSNGFKGVLRNTAKIVAFAAMGNGPWLRRRLDAVRGAGVATILNLHRVADDDGSDYRPLDPGLFDELLTFAKREFAIVTISELREKTVKPKLVLSFDDGYRDFVTTAVPILKKHGVKANQNIIPRCVESGLPPLNVIAQDFVGRAPSRLVKELRVEGFSAPAGPRYGQRLSRFLKMRPQAEQDRIAEDLLPQFRRWEEFKPTAMMSLDEVCSLDGHEIGAHSFAHSSMEFESDAYLDADVARCADYFRDKLGKPMTIYAFPNGSCRAGQAERVLTHGADHVLLVGERFDQGTRIHHRITFDGRSSSEIRYKALGGRAPL